MDIWLPCIKFNIETVETRYSRPTELDLLLLRFISDKIRRVGICKLSDVLEVFAVMDSTVLHGMIHKLHVRYLQLFPDGTVDLRDGLAAIVDDDDEEALTVQVGERNGLYPAYFDLFAGQVILDNRFTTVAETRADGTQLLPADYGQLDYERPGIFSKQHYFALVNDYLRQRVSDDMQTDSYRVQSLRKHPEPDLGLQYLPLKVFRSGERLQINSQNAVPTVALMKIAAKVNRMRAPANGHAGIPSLQIEGVPDDAGAMQQQIDVWLQRSLGFAPPTGSPVSLELRTWTNIAEMVAQALASTGDTVMDIGYLRDAIEKAPTTVYAALIGFLGRGGRLTIASTESSVPDSLPLWRTVGAMKEVEHTDPGASLFVEDGGTAELRDLRSCRRFETVLSTEQLKRFTKKLRQAKEVQEIRYLIPKDGAAATSLSVIWTSHGVILPLVSERDVVHGLCSSEFELTADLHWTAVEQCVENRRLYLQRDAKEFRLTRLDAVDTSPTNAVGAGTIDGRIDVFSEELFDGILMAMASAEMNADADVILRPGPTRTALVQTLQRSGIRVYHDSAQAPHVDVAVIAPSTVMVRLEGYALWISDLAPAAIESLKATLLAFEGPS